MYLGNQFFYFLFVLFLSNKDQSAWVLYKVVSGDTLLQDALGNGSEEPSSLLEAYHLRDETEDISANSLKSQGTNEYNHFPQEKEVVIDIHCFYFFVLYNHILILMLKKNVLLCIKSNFRCFGTIGSN